MVRLIKVRGITLEAILNRLWRSSIFTFLQALYNTLFKPCQKTLELISRQRFHVLIFRFILFGHRSFNLFQRILFKVFQIVFYSLHLLSGYLQSILCLLLHNLVMIFVDNIESGILLVFRGCLCAATFCLCLFTLSPL